ncbi:ribonuclease P protein component [Microbacterium sp. ARD31]|uniref:ribonuclease P protein component n=1 Tax=Microbacterium sp. ARD31 TaxID=2962576 RepID=UPI0028811A6E|nr:ribonuclease P protein component [Microbacterium sp. ARD31]MDT0185910.1 ribonuclease P protein component [Microbacterium sp. ARD31]
MLSTVNRLTDSDGFRRAVRGGRRAGSTTLVVHLACDTSAEPGPPQVGFTVSKAVGNAVTRNRVKRRLRHLTRERLPVLEELPGRAALVVRALPAAAGASYATLGADLDRTLERVSRS